jgi:hypothetical protein
MPGVMMEKAKLLEMIETKIVTEFIIVEEVDDDSLTVEPFTGTVPDNMEDGLAEISSDNPKG